MSRTMLRTGMGTLLVAAGLGIAWAGWDPPVEAGKKPDKKSYTKSFDLDGFDGVDLNYGILATIVRSEAYSVKLFADEDIFDLVKVEKNGTTLKIALDTSKNLPKTINGLKAEVTMPLLRSIRLGLGTDASIKDFKSSQDLEINMRGASRLTGDIEANDVFIRVQDALGINLKGAGRYATIKGSGGGPILLEQFALEGADIEVNGGIILYINAKRKLDYSLKAACLLYYAGDPKLGKTQATQASQVHKIKGSVKK